MSGMDLEASNAAVIYKHSSVALRVSVSSVVQDFDVAV